MNNYFLLFITPLLVSLILTPLIVTLATRNEVVDIPNERKIHKQNKPLIGGFGLYIAILITVLSFYSFSLHLTALLMTTTIIVGLGLSDDFHTMRPFIKLFGQIGAAVILVTLCTQSFQPILAYFEIIPGLRFLSYVIVVIWIIAITNAFNLIDGLDGLCTGNAIITGGFLIVLSYIYGNPWALGISLIMTAACLGFYPYNFQPARIFLGDTGSMLVGFTLSAIFLFVIQQDVKFSSLFGGALFFSYPVVDTFYAVYRRIKDSMPIFTADKEHIHHQLLNAGFSVRHVDYIIYAFGIIMGACGLALILYPGWAAYLAFFVLGSLAVAGLIIIRRRTRETQTPPPAEVSG